MSSNPQTTRMVRTSAQPTADELLHFFNESPELLCIAGFDGIFEKRLLTAQLLEQNLVAKAASVAPSPDPEAQARYEQARRSLLNQLQASANLGKPE